MAVPGNALILKIVNQMIWRNNRDCVSMEMSRSRGGDSYSPFLHLTCLFAWWKSQMDLAE